MSKKFRTTKNSLDRENESTDSTTWIRTEYLDHAGYRFVLLLLENHADCPMVLSPASLTALEVAIRALDLSQVDAVAVTSSGPTFCSGADLKKMVEASTPGQAEDAARRGLEVFGLLAALTVPTFTFINGDAIGGGLELALHTDYRVAAASVRAIGFPEVRLGLVPGWGGIPRAVALLGPELTARLMITDALAGKFLSAKTAMELGLVDAVLLDNDFHVSSLDFAADILATQATLPAHARRYRELSLRSSAGNSRLADIRTQLEFRLRGAAPAPYSALELIGAASISRDRQARAAAEIQAFGELLLSDEARASIYAFQLTRSLSKNPAGRPATEPLTVHSVGIVGAGLMASQLALMFARQLKVPVRITDLSQDRIDSALRWTSDQLEKMIARRQMDADGAQVIRSLITGSTVKADLADCAIVIEAVFEDIDVKRAVLAELEPLLGPEALLLTNTSSLSIAAIGAGLTRPEKLIGFHFFNPVAALPLVEIIASPQTAKTTLATGFELAKRLGKTAVLTTDTTGFVVNRLLTRLFSEILSLLDNGIEPDTVNHCLDPLGLPMSPLQLLQLIGPAVQLHICEMMHRAYPHRFAVSTSLTALVSAGLPGYLDDSGAILMSPYLLLGAQPADPADLRARILAALAEEVTEMLEEGVVAGPEQIDLCLILGANFPFHAGGLTPLLDREVGTAFHPEMWVSTSI